MTDARCLKCRERLAPGWQHFCGWCLGRLTSLHSQVALAQGQALTLEQRKWLMRWFLQTKFFAHHRRMSRGRAKKILKYMGAEGINPANVLPRGPHDPVTDSAPSHQATQAG